MLGGVERDGAGGKARSLIHWYIRNTTLLQVERAVLHSLRSVRRPFRGKSRGGKGERRVRITHHRTPQSAPLCFFFLSTCYELESNQERTNENINALWELNLQELLHLKSGYNIAQLKLSTEDTKAMIEMSWHFWNSDLRWGLFVMYPLTPRDRLPKGTVEVLVLRW